MLQCRGHGRKFWRGHATGGSYDVSNLSVKEIPLRARSTDAFVELVGGDRVEHARRLGLEVRRKLEGRTIWNVTGSSAGSGVAEMLHTLLDYVRGLGVDTRWLVIAGSPAFFRVTKRLHHALHGETGDGSPLDREATTEYERVSAETAEELARSIRVGDVVILHDPHTAGLAPHLASRGARVVWRCHGGADGATVERDRAWAFLAPYLARAHAFVFSRFDFLPDVLDPDRCLVVSPAIDPFSPKNQEMNGSTARGILMRLGLLAGVANGARSFTRRDGTTALVERRAEIVRDGEPPRPDVPLVIQISRWDRLKDPVGALQGFAQAVESHRAGEAQLVLAGPDVHAVSDDPEGLEALEEVAVRWRALPDAARRRVQIVTLPMDDIEENAAMVNALQRHAAIVVQKSLREGFGLTVTEAMWKARPLVASAVGGIRDQVQHGVSGLLLKNPDDLDAFAGSIGQLLDDPALAERLGRNGRARVAQNYLGLGVVGHFDDVLDRLA
jgi:trehalose synthase